MSTARHDPCPLQEGGPAWKILLVTLLRTGGWWAAVIIASGHCPRILLAPRLPTFAALRAFSDASGWVFVLDAREMRLRPKTLPETPLLRFRHCQRVASGAPAGCPLLRHLGVGFVDEVQENVEVDVVE